MISVIKPDVVEKSVIGKIYSRFEESGLCIIAAKIKQLSECEAKEFYTVHRGHPFYEDLVKFMARNPVTAQVLEGKSAAAKDRELMGVTSPADAAPGTIHTDSAESVGVNVVHGSDDVENAAIEIVYFFNQGEIYPQQKQKVRSHYTAIRFHIGRQNCFVRATDNRSSETPKGFQSRVDR